MEATPNRRRGAQPGNKNARKANGKAEAFLMCRVRSEDKKSWYEAAHREGMTLSRWVILRLNYWARDI